MNREDLIVRKSFAISHHNGFIWAENLDALYDFADIVESKFLNDMKQIKRPSTPSMIAINLNETTTKENLAETIVGGLVDAGGSVRKVAFVGLRRKYISIMKQALNSHNAGFTFRFFDDFMEAKDWLV